MDAAAHMYPSDLETFQESATFAHAYSVPVSNPDERSVPLYRTEQVEYVAHEAVLRALDEAGVRVDVLRGMCIEVALEKARECFVA
jgi:hypothetical protein